MPVASVALNEYRKNLGVGICRMFITTMSAYLTDRVQWDFQPLPRAPECRII
jgi:hypothetical protein